MTGDATSRGLLRGWGIAIAVAGIIDPAITTRRSTKPDVVVVAADSVEDTALADEVAGRLAKTYTVARGPLAGASATVVAGTVLPAERVRRDAPIFAIAPSIDRARLTIESLNTPSTAPALSRARIDATIRVVGARGKRVDITLRDASLAIDRVTRPIATNDDRLHVALSFVPPAAAPTSLRVVAHVDGADDAVGDALIDVRREKWSVLFYDAQPSWMSTFVRRAIEDDPRFVATSRIVTSRNVTTSAGAPPGRLDDLAALSPFDAIVVGSPQGLSTSDVAGLEAFMRRRGANVVLLLDESPTGDIARLIDAGSWTTMPATQPTSLPMARDDSVVLRASRIVYPSALPAGAQAITGHAAAVWREPVGAGTLVVSGALDAWHFRDPATSSFDRFWQTAIGDAASRTPRPVTITTSKAVVAPGERFDVRTTLRDEALDVTSAVAGPVQLRATVGGAVDSAAVVHLWPQTLGRLEARVRAPRTPGLYHVSISAGERRGDVPFVVARGAHPILASAAAQLADWTRATGGQIVPAANLDRLTSVLAATVRVEPRSITWHPMRSGWWIIPFALALSGEWWLRRKRGLP